VTLEDQLDAAELDAQKLVAGLSEEQGAWRPAPGSWSIAECLDHLAKSDRVYLDAMLDPARRARQQGRYRRGPAVPGFIGGWFAKTLEPPVKARFPAPRKLIPNSAPSLAEASGRFVAAHRDVRAFLESYADLDLAGIGFLNPLLPGVRFSLATGLHAIAAHERRHLWQAWRIRSNQ
jgi:hypothetical protein